VKTVSDKVVGHSWPN